IRVRGLIVCRGRDRTSVLEARQAERRADPDLRGPSCSRFHSQPSAPAVRRCIWCGLTKPIDDFAFRNRALGTRQSQCRECHATYRRTHYLRNRPEYIAREANRVRERRKQNRRLLQDYRARDADRGGNLPEEVGGATLHWLREGKASRRVFLSRPRPRAA